MYGIGERDFDSYGLSLSLSWGLFSQGNGGNTLIMFLLTFHPNISTHKTLSCVPLLSTMALQYSLGFGLGLLESVP